MGADDAATDMLPAAGAPVVGAGSLIGRTLGKFEVLEPLGRGGSGDVFRAEQTQLGRSAVIKVLRREVALSPVRIDRFLREAKIASRLDHPYAAHVYAFGAEPDGVLWIAMEHVRGATLDELVLRRGAIPPAIFGPLFARLCEVVHTAHELGIVHRDIKGSNVMVIERAGQLLPKLIDLGIAKAIAASEGRAPTEQPHAPAELESDSGLTEHGATLGSPHYMSPEQWSDASSVDARADVYALGVLAYRCIAGRVPFRFTDRATLVDAHLRRPPPPLPETVPAPLADAVLRALEKDPAARWQTALAFGGAVQRAVGTAAHEAVPIFDPYTRDVWLRAGPQPIADAVAHVAAASTSIEADAAVRELVAITCRWLAVLALSQLPQDADVPALASVREGARGVVGRDDAGPWLELARVAMAASGTDGHVPGLVAAIAGSGALAELADRLDDRDRVRAATSLIAALSQDIEAAAEALRPIEPLLAYQLVVGTAGGAESWQGPRRRDRDRVVVWGEQLAPGEVALLDAAGRVVARLSPLAQVIAPLPSAEPELFLLWRSGRGAARLVAAPWGFERDDDAAGERLAALTTEDGETAHDAEEHASPYPGLAAYGVADAERFVGREREVESLANRLIRAPMLAVLGPSGAGKSSFIHAGVLPRLTEHYRVLTMRPGRHPMAALAALPELAGALEPAARLRELGERAPRGLVLVIDQLEELVTLCADADERRRFAATLAAAADASSAPVRVVVTLRDDFAAVIESEAGFRGRFEVFVLGTPTPDALRRIVIEPARRAAVAVDPAVVDDMVAEVAGRPASLPLLSFTAAQLWDARDRTARRITRESYLALGGVAGALSTYADQIYDGLSHRDQASVRALFARLVAGDGTRIPAPRRELEQLPGAATVLAHLIDARLLVVREDDQRADLVELVHECLAERWDRLARWRREDAVDRALVGDLRAAARRWQDTGRRPDALWRGAALVELRRLLARDAALTDDERSFAAAAAAADRRSRTVRRGAVIIAIATLALLAGVMAALGAAARDSAERERAAATLAEDRLTASLVTQGRVELNDGRALPALAYFAEALRRGADSPGLRFMIAVASRGWRDELHVERQAGVAALEALPDGGVVTGSTTGVLRFYSPAGALTAEVATDLPDLGVLAVRGDRVLALSPRGLRVVEHGRVITRAAIEGSIRTGAFGPAADELTLVEDAQVAVVGLDGSRRRAIPAARLPGDPDTVFADDHVYLVTPDATLVALDLHALTSRTLAADVRGSKLASSPDHALLAYTDTAGAIHALAPDGQPRFTIQPTAPGSELSWSASGERLVVAAKHQLALYDRAGALVTTYDVDAGSQRVIAGDELWTGGDDGTLRHYHAGGLVASLPAHTTNILGLRVTPTLAAAASSDGSLVIERADSAQLALGHACPHDAAGPADVGYAYVCKDGHTRYYAGARLIGETPNATDTGGVTLEPTSGRAAIDAGDGSDNTFAIYDATGARIAATSTTAGAHEGVSAFADATHLLVLETGKPGALWRWDFVANTWARVIDVDQASAIGHDASGDLVGFTDGRLIALRGSQIVRTLNLGEAIEYLGSTRDGAWTVAHLASGGTAILEAATGIVTHRLEAADENGVAPMFDDTGALILRTMHGYTTVWDRATGDDLVSTWDLLHVSEGVAFGSGGRLELQGDRVGTIDLGRDLRPASALIHDIECKVPLAIRDGRLQPTKPACSP